jgi:MFS family permease
MLAENPIQATGELMAALAVTLVLCSLIGGWLSDRIGARRMVCWPASLHQLDHFY